MGHQNYYHNNLGTKIMCPDNYGARVWLMWQSWGTKWQTVMAIMGKQNDNWDNHGRFIMTIMGQQNDHHAVMGQNDHHDNHVATEWSLWQSCGNRMIIMTIMWQQNDQCDNHGAAEWFLTTIMGQKNHQSWQSWANRTTHPANHGITEWLPEATEWVSQIMDNRRTQSDGTTTGQPTPIWQRQNVNLK